MFPSLLPGAIGVKLPLDQTLKLAQASGFGGVSLDIAEAAVLGPSRVSDLFEQAGLRIGSWGLPVQFRNDEATFEADMQKLPRLVRVAEKIGADRCSTWIMPCHDELEFAENLDLHARRLEEVARALGQHGIRLGLEFVGPKTLRCTRKYEFVHDMPGMFELIGAIGVPNVGLLLDSFHWFTSHATIGDLKAIQAAEIVDVHINDGVAGRDRDEQLDNERALPGETGVIDLPTFLTTLHGMGYDGPVATEPFSRPLRELPPEQSAGRTAEAMKKLWQSADVPWHGPRS